ncbi:MAG: tetratricopeptide repeat protein, partial [Myxococcota bacterium]
ALALLRYLVRNAADVPGLVVVTLPSPMHRPLRNQLETLVQQIEGLHLALPPLSQPEAVDLVRGLLPVPSELATRIAEASGGHPLSAVRLVTDLVRRGQLRGDATGVVIDPSVPLPDSLGSLYEGALAQVETLGMVGRTALELAAFLGPTVAFPEWRGACRLLGVDLDPQLLGTIVTQGFVAPTRGGRYRFGQGVLRDALVDAAGREGRAAMLHEICGQVLASGGDSVSARAGEHFESAQRPDLAAEAYLRAMRWLSGWDREKALELGTRWYACLGRVAGDGDPRWANGMQVLVELLGVQGGDAHQRATEELLQRGRGDPQAETRALIELSYADLRAQEIGRASARAELAWHKSTNTPLRAEAAVARAEVRRHRGEFAQAEQILREVLEQDNDAAVVTLALARVLCDDGRGREALRILDARADRTATAAPMIRARLQRARGRAWFVQGDRERAVQLFEDACALRDRAGFDWPVLDLDLAPAVAPTHPTRAMRLLEHALSRLDATHDARPRSDALSMLAWMHATAGQWEKVEEHMDGLEDLPQRGRRPETLSRLLELAELAIASGELLLARRARRWVRGEAHTTPLPH